MFCVWFVFVFFVVQDFFLWYIEEDQILCVFEYGELVFCEFIGYGVINFDCVVLCFEGCEYVVVWKIVEKVVCDKLVENYKVEVVVY